MGHFEDSLFAGVADKLGREGITYLIGDKVYVDGYRNIRRGIVFEVVRCERNHFFGEEFRTYDVIDKVFGMSLHGVPENRLRLCETSGRFMSDSATTYRNYMVPKRGRIVEPEKVIFNDPATIVLWDDGTKTVVKCSEGDIYDPEKGFMLCYLKKQLGKSYYKYISKTVKKYKED